MYWCIKEKGDYQHMTWRNGKGKSIQIHIEPIGSTLNDAFQYRISRAIVSTAGPFSTFDGYNRTLIILKGNKLSLFHRQKPNESINLDYFKPYNFNGSFETDSVFIPLESNDNDTDSNTTTTNNNNNNYLSLPINNFIDSNCSISPNSPIYLQQQQNLPIPKLNKLQIEETYDFGIISKESEIKHTCTVISFDDDDDGKGKNVDHDDDDVEFIRQIILNPSEFSQNSTIIFYSYNAELTFKYSGIENSKMKASLLPDQTLIIKDINFDTFNPQPTIITITHTARPNLNEPSKLIYVKIEPINQQQPNTSS